jgi:diguanylate cyclase (GGDEF)-like protein/PAS domain S-box-containing protein
MSTSEGHPEVGVDVGERKMTEESNKVQEFINEVATSVAIVERDWEGRIVVSACNEAFFQMTGGRTAFARRFPVPFDALVPRYAWRELREKVTECFTSGVAQELEQAYDLRDGTHWWRLSLNPMRHKLGDAATLDILLTGLDITPKMELTRQLEISTSRFRSVVDAAYDAIITVDQEHNITLFNRAAEYLFGYSQSEMIGQPLSRLIPDRFRERHSDYIRHFAHSPVDSREMNERGRIYGLHRDGSLLPVEIAISKINVSGLLEFTAVIRDIADRIHLMDLLQKEAETDELTGLPNRRTFLDTAANLFRSSEQVSLFMLDVDHFKKVNDTYGHDAGDEVLRALADAGRSYTRGRDIFARLGGEEFVALLPGTDLEMAHETAEKLRTAFEQRDFVHYWRTGKPIPFTVSIGVATRGPGELDVEEVLKRADQALYRAKEGGRNRVETDRF